MGRSKSESWKNPLHIECDGARAVAKSLLAGNKLRKKLETGVALGTFLIELPCAESIALLAIAGFDFVVLDLEHSSVDMSQLKTLILAGHAAGLPVIVRSWANDVGLLSKILDMGASGVMVPHVDTAARAKEVVDACRFAPIGRRGFSPLAHFDSLEHPLEELSESTFVIVQIEGADALKRVNEISDVSGVDAVFVGPYDLALSMGVPPGSEEVFAEAKKLENLVSDNVCLGIYIDDPSTSGKWANRNFKLQCVSFDGRMLANGARNVVESARKSAATQSE